MTTQTTETQTVQTTTVETQVVKKPRKGRSDKGVKRGPRKPKIV